MDVYVQLGELCEKQLGRPEQATSYYSQALELDGAHLPSLVALERIYRERGEWDELVEVLKRKATFRGGELAHAVARKISRSCWPPSSSWPRSTAITSTTSTRRSSSTKRCWPSSRRTWRHCAASSRSTSRRERWQDLPKMLEAQLEAVRTEKERIAILGKLARLFEEEFVKPEKAAERLEQILEIDPNHLDALGRPVAHLPHAAALGRRASTPTSATWRPRPTAPRRSRSTRLSATSTPTSSRTPARAIDTYLNVTNLDENDVEALDALVAPLREDRRPRVVHRCARAPGASCCATRAAGRPALPHRSHPRGQARRSRSAAVATTSAPSTSTRRTCRRSRRCARSTSTAATGSRRRARSSGRFSTTRTRASSRA